MKRVIGIKAIDPFAIQQQVHDSAAEGKVVEYFEVGFNVMQSGFGKNYIKTAVTKLTLIDVLLEKIHLL